MYLFDEGMDLLSVSLDMVIPDLNLCLTILWRINLSIIIYFLLFPYIQVEETLLFLFLSSAVEWDLAPSTH